MEPGRRTVTVVFADVVGSTSLGEARDPEAVRALMAGWFGNARDTLESHGGTVEKFIGDAVMAVFGVPTAHEDDALRAVRAAAELRERVTAVQLRIGVNTGEVVAGEGETLVTGDAVNVAARLEQATEPGEILIGETTYRLVSAAVDVDGPAQLTVKGKSEPIRAYRLRALHADAEAITRRLDVPLVGRERELDDLRSEYDLAKRERTCRLVSVLGDPGIGKSRLMHELAASVGGEATVATGRCLPYGDGITYWPVVEMLRDVDARDVRQTVLDVFAGEADAALVADRLAAATGQDDVAASSDDIAWAVRRFFEQLARERPLVVVVDDIQWAESTLLDLVERLAYLSRNAPMLVLCLARTELLDVRPRWPGTRIMLDPLSFEDSARLIESLGGSPDVGHVAETAAGNPLFIEQLVAMLEAANGDRSMTIPPTIQAVLAARLDRLAPDERAAIEAASVVGQEFWSGAVRSLVRSEVEIGASLTSLIRQNLIQPSHAAAFAGEDAFAFAHLLVRDAAYAGISKERRATQHEQLADWLQARDLETGARHEEIVGYHLEHAARYRRELGIDDDRAGVLAARAAELLARAGQRARVRGDYGAATTLLERARELTADARTRVELAIDVAESLFRVGDIARAQAALRDAEAGAQSHDVPNLAARARTVRGWLDLLTDPNVRAAPLARDLEEMLPMLEAAEDEDTLARATQLLGFCAFTRGQSTAAERWLRRSLDHAERAGPVTSSAWAALIVLSGVYLYGPLPARVAIARLEELVETHGGDSPRAEGVLLRAIGVLRAMRGDFDGGRELLVRAERMLGELGDNVEQVNTVFFRAPLELMAGQPAEAERVARTSYEFLEAAGETGFRSSAAVELGESLLALGRHGDAERYAQVSEEISAPDDYHSQAGWRAVRASVFAHRGKLDTAEQLAREAVEIMRAIEAPAVLADCLVRLSEVLQLDGRNDEAADAVREARDLYAHKGHLVAVKRADELLEVLAAESPTE